MSYKIENERCKSTGGITQTIHINGSLQNQVFLLYHYLHRSLQCVATFISIRYEESSTLLYDSRARTWTKCSRLVTASSYKTELPSLQSKRIYAFVVALRPPVCCSFSTHMCILSYRGIVRLMIISFTLADVVRGCGTVRHAAKLEMHVALQSTYCFIFIDL